MKRGCLSGRLPKNLFLWKSLTEVFEAASRAPSGGNVQPWKIVILCGEKLDNFKALMRERLSGKPHPEGEASEYSVYPSKIKEPYRTARFEVGEEMYGLLGIPREDKAKRLEWFANNYQFFGAPAAAFCFVDRVMGAAAVVRSRHVSAVRHAVVPGERDRHLRAGGLVYPSQNGWRVL